MREIKFRAWDEAMGKMIYPVGMIYESGKVIGVSEDIYGFSASLDHPNREGSDYGILYLNAGFVLMQYTGLKDSEGNDIYEGDLVKSHMGILEVIFDQGRFKAKMKDQPEKWGYFVSSEYFHQVPVIGNLYQNQELLNEPQNANGGID